jgi:Ca2+-dependent lipid-binding protein
MDSKEDHEEDAGTEKKEKQEGNAQPGSDITNQEADETVSSRSGTPQTQQGTISAGEGTQTEEHSSSLFGSLFSILMKHFSLIASFLGGFFSWLFGSNEEKADESISQSDDDVSLPTSSSLDDSSYDTINTPE